MLDEQFRLTQTDNETGEVTAAIVGYGTTMALAVSSLIQAAEGDSINELALTALQKDYPEEWAEIYREENNDED